MAVVKPTNPLLKSKQAEVARRVSASNLPVADFEFVEMNDSQVITSLLYVPDHNFHFDFFPGDNWVVRYSPGEHTTSSGMQGVGDWVYVLERVNWWLSYLKRELDTPDPWTAFAESVESFNFGSGADDNTPFTPDEQVYLSTQLDQIKNLLLNAGVEAEDDRHAIIAGINRLEEAKGRLGRLDWRGLALGTLFELLLIGYATPDGVRGAVNLLVGAAQHLLR